MARNVTTDLTNTDPATAQDPYGKVRDDAVPGDQTGTPVVEAMLGDMITFFQRLMAENGVTPNNLPDNAVNGFQLYDAFLARQSAERFTKQTIKEVSSTGTSPRVIAFGNSKWVMTGNIAADVFSSINGEDWVDEGAGTGIQASPFDMVFAEGLFVLIDSSDVKTSPDGITWTERTANSNDHFCLGYDEDNSQFVTGGASEMHTSPDGITWTQRTTGLSGFTFRAIDANGGTIIGVQEATGSNQIARSTDGGLTWTTIAAPQAQFCQEVRGGGDGLWLIGTNSGTNRVYASTDDGLTWTEIAITVSIDQIGFGDGTFLLWANDSYWITVDCVNFTEIPHPFNPLIGSDENITFGQGRFALAVGNTSDVQQGVVFIG